MRFLTILSWCAAIAGLGLIVHVLMGQQGAVNIVWLGYEIRTSFAVLALGALALILGFAVLVSWMEKLLAWPSHLKAQHHLSTQKQENNAMTQAFAALAASDVAGAEKFAKKAEKSLGELPLLDLLGAQVAHKQGDNATTVMKLERLAQHDSTKFLAHRALSGVALRSGDEVKALEYALAATKDNPQQTGQQAASLGLLLRLGRWQEAERHIFQARLRRHIDAGKASHYSALLYYAKSQALQLAGVMDSESLLYVLKKAHEKEPSFVPAATSLAHLYASSKDYRKAYKTLFQAWKTRPHPELAQTLLELHHHEPAAKREKQVAQWVEAYPDAPESIQLKAQLMADFGDKEGAIAVLKNAVMKTESARLLKMVASLEAHYAQDEKRLKSAAQLLERAGVAPHDAHWHCTSCGHIHPQWQLFCGACESFDGVAWGVPITNDRREDSLQLL